jgi:Mn2+/Fe2+ NRAMP family transporter
MLKYLGPGILLAGAAIGGSHLVASTQAGATYGWSLLWILVLINLFKYPFFKYAQRYTAATGKTILHGYLNLGQGYLILFFVMNILTSFVNIAGVSMITGSLATNFGFTNFSVPVLSGFYMLSSVLIIIFGGFALLRKFGKIVIGVLGVSTLTAMIISVINCPVAPAGFEGESPWTIASFGFIIMFMGWMPAPIEASIWPSLWMRSQEVVTKKSAIMREAMIDFHAGYLSSVFFAAVFLILGKMVLFGSGITLSSQGPVFARQLIDIYATTIGPLARPLIMLAAWSAMFSTTLTTVDAYPRALATSTKLLFTSIKTDFYTIHKIWLVVSTIAAFLIISIFVNSLGDMLALAMIASFLTAPVFAILNFRVISRDPVPEAFRPNLFEKIISYSGIAFLIGFGIIFIIWYFL